MSEAIDSNQLEQLFENIRSLANQAINGNYQATYRFNAIGKLADSHFDFAWSDVQRIEQKKEVRVSQQLKRGRELYRTMAVLMHLVEPIGKGVGPSCRVRKIEFENLTFKSLFELPYSTGLLFRAVGKETEFNGLNLLNGEERMIYAWLGPQFGSKKKPTLQSLAYSWLAEGDEKEAYSERSMHNYLAAARSERQHWKGPITIDRLKGNYRHVERFGEDRKSMGISLIESLVMNKENLERTINMAVQGVMTPITQILAPFTNFPAIFPSQSLLSGISNLIESFATQRAEQCRALAGFNGLPKSLVEMQRQTVLGIARVLADVPNGLLYHNLTAEKLA